MTETQGVPSAAPALSLYSPSAGIELEWARQAVGVGWPTGAHYPPSVSPGPQLE